LNYLHPRLEFIPEAFNPLVLGIAQATLPFLLRFRTRPWLTAGISKIETANGEVLVNLYQQFQSGKIRFLMAFRHAEVEDPLCLFYLFSRAIPRLARQEGISLQLPIHSHFIYDRGMTVWGGDWLGWLFSRLGGIPIHRGKPLDRVALKNARHLFLNGTMPLTVAPEGATNGHGEIISPLEPGVARLGFWCVEDLLKINSSAIVFIVPISLRYYYLNPPWAKLDRLLSQLEADTGLPAQSLKKSDVEAFYQRLFRLGEHLLSEMEQFYRRFYQRTLADIPAPEPSISPNQVLYARLQALLDVALGVAEEYFHLDSQGTIIHRCRRLEEAGWNAIYREDIRDLRALSPLQRGLGDWIAQEADIRLKHMRLVESFVAVTGSYVKEKPTFERFAETALILFDLVARIKGKKIPRRPFLGKRWVQITVGEPISVTERWSNYNINRSSAKQTVTDLTQDLQLALEDLI
jgi:1-acyl-sn-glycerol-3-phosphate acyltransferase